MPEKPSTDTADATWSAYRAAVQAAFEAKKPSLRPFTARPASDSTVPWPLWFVADRTGLNRTSELSEAQRGKLPFVTQAEAERLAMVANG